MTLWKKSRAAFTALTEALEVTVAPETASTFSLNLKAVTNAVNAGVDFINTQIRGE